MIRTGYFFAEVPPTCISRITNLHTYDICFKVKIQADCLTKQLKQVILSFSSTQIRAKQLLAYLGIRVFLSYTYAFTNKTPTKLFSKVPLIAPITQRLSHTISLTAIFPGTFKTDNCVTSFELLIAQNRFHRYRHRLATIC